MTVQFKVIGVPKPQGSMIPGKRKDGKLFLRPANDQTKSWRAIVAEVVSELATDLHRKLSGPLFVEVVFRFPMPKSRPKAQRLHGTAWHVVTPDADKLCRALGDALKEGGLIQDDSWIARWSVVKAEIWDGWSGAAVRVTEMSDLLVLPEWAQ